MAEPLPFEHLFRPLVLAAGEELRRQTSVALFGLLTPAAYAGWEQYLLARLTAASAKAAHWQFQIFKTVCAAFPMSGSHRHGPTDSLYREFIGIEPRQRLRSLFEEFPGLARLCDALVANWIAAVKEFLTRTNVDRSGFEVRFSAEECVCPITGIDAGLSDAHCGGRAAIRVVFDSGTRLIYKPRSIAPETHFSELLNQLNSAGIPYPFRSPRCWDRGNYGWMENIDPRPCDTRVAVRNFYWRAGALLGLCYLAHGVDIHRENMIAAGEYPVLIDLEALAHPQERGPLKSENMLGSILRTGFLPRGIAGNGRNYEWGALSRKLHVRRPVPTWVRINEDDMSLQTLDQEFTNACHLPVFDGSARLASDFVSEIQAGYRWVGEQLLGSASPLESLNIWLRDLVDCPRRQILRPTVVYQEALSRRTLPELLRGAPLPANLLPVAAVIDEEQSRMEYQAIEQLDIPYFLQKRRPSALFYGDGKLPTLQGYLEQSTLIEQSLLGDEDAQRTEQETGSLPQCV